MSRRPSGRSIGSSDSPRKIAAERGWRPATVSVWLVIADGRDEPAPGRRRTGRCCARRSRSTAGRSAAGSQSPRGAIAAMSFLPSTRWSECERGSSRRSDASARRRPSVAAADSRPSMRQASAGPSRAGRQSRPVLTPRVQGHGAGPSWPLRTHRVSTWQRVTPGDAAWHSPRRIQGGRVGRRERRGGAASAGRGSATAGRRTRDEGAVARPLVSPISVGRGRAPDRGSARASQLRQLDQLRALRERCWPPS